MEIRENKYNLSSEVPETSVLPDTLHVWKLFSRKKKSSNGKESTHTWRCFGGAVCSTLCKRFAYGST